MSEFYTKPTQNPFTYTFYRLYSATYLLAKVSRSYIISWGSIISHNFAIMCLDDVAFVIIESDDIDLSFPDFSPVAVDYTIHMNPAKEG